MIIVRKTNKKIKNQKEVDEKIKELNELYGLYQYLINNKDEVIKDIEKILDEQERN